MEKLKIKEAAKYADKSDSWIRKKILNDELRAEKRLLNTVKGGSPLKKLLMIY